MNIIKVFRGSFNYGISYIDDISRINVDNGLIAIICKKEGVKIGNKLVFENNDELNRCGYDGVQIDDKILRMDIIAAILGVYEKFVIVDKHYEVYTSYNIKLVKIKPKPQDTTYCEY